MTTPDTATHDWFNITFVRLTLDGHRGDYDPRFLSKLDLDKIVDQIDRTGAEVVTFMGVDISGYAIYNSKLNPKYPGYRDLDYLGEMVRRLHAKSIRVMIDYAGLWNRRLRRQHPDWVQVDSTGKEADLPEEYPGVQAGHKIRTVCLNSPARQEIIEGICEVIKTYEIDGIWMDMPTFFKYCHCKSCQEKFRKEFGAEIPLSPDHELWSRFIRWRRDCVVDYSKEVWEAAKAVRPDIIFKKNFIFRYGDSATAETIDSGMVADTALSDLYPTKGELWNSIAVRFLKSVSRNGLPEALYYRGSNYTWAAMGNLTYYAATKSQSQMLTEAFTAVANGCAFGIGDFMHAEGYFYDEAIDRFSQVLQEVRDRKEWLIGAEPVPYAGLYFSQDTRDSYSDGLKHRYSDHFEGAFRTLLEEHIPFEIVHHKNLANRFGDGLKVLVMPQAACLSEQLAEEIRTFVKNGGGLVATYETSRFDESGTARQDFLLDDVFGATYGGNDTGYYSDFLEMGKEHPVTCGLSREIPLQNLGAQLKVMASPEAEVLGTVVTPYWKDHPDHYVQLLHPPGIPTDLPSIIVNEYGDGRVVYLPSRIDAVYTALNIPEARRLIANAVRWAAKDELLVLEAPSCIEATLYAQEEAGRTIVHLVNVQPTEDTVPVTAITVKVHVDKPVRKVTLAPEQSEPEYKVENKVVTVRVPQVDYHRMVVIEH